MHEILTEIEGLAASFDRRADRLRETIVDRRNPGPNDRMALARIGECVEAAEATRKLAARLRAEMAPPTTETAPVDPAEPAPPSGG